MTKNFEPCVDCREKPATRIYLSPDGACVPLCESCNDVRLHADSKKEDGDLNEILKLKTVRKASVLP